MTPFVGAIMQFGFNFAPQGWALCNGATLPISGNEVLYSLIGTTFGGDGVSTFLLPNLQGRNPIGAGQGVGLPAYSLGQVGGTESVTLTSNNLPAHSHNVATPVSNASATTNSPVNAYFTTNSASVTFNPASVRGTVTPTSYAPASVSGATAAPYPTGAAGSSIPLPTLAPFQVINYCIATQGIYPSRN